MGWLRELMAASEPAIASYGDLARRCLENREWPRDIQPQARSLASLFSKFDRGMEVEWLAERREVQHVLAQTLALPLRTIEHEVAKHLDHADRNLNRFRFNDAPNARPIDLREENLPAIFDERLTRPGLWQRLWWTAKPGAGQDLVSKWLQARALAEYAAVDSWESVVSASAAAPSPLFVEYTGKPPSSEQTQQLGNRPLCIASTSPAPEGFLGVSSKDIGAAEAPLLRWLEPLWVQTAPLSLDAVASWLARLRERGMGHELESMLGLVALAYETGLEPLESLEPPALATLFLSKVIQQTSFKTSTEGPWLEQNAHEVLRGIARNALSTQTEVWNTPRSQADWLSLVPTEYQRGVDAEWTRVSLQQAGAPLTVSELEKALKAVPPGGFRVVESLRNAQLLREGPTSRLTLRPRWLADYFEVAGYSALLEESADSWGKVALDARRLNGIVTALNREYALSQFRTLDAALELDDDESAGYALAIELLVATSGRLLLLGKELEPEQVGGLLRLQANLLIPRESPFEEPMMTLVPGPRLLVARRDVVGWGNWLLSLWALCEHSSEVSALAAANPWGPNPTLDEAALALVSCYLETAELPVVAGAYAMLGRLLQYLERMAEGATALQPTLRMCSAHPLFAVARVLRGDGWDAWELVLKAPHGVQSVRHLVTDETWPYLAKTAWRTWHEKGSPLLGLTLFATSERKDLFWPHLQDRVLRALLDERHSIVRQVPSECMKSDWVTMYLERVPEQTDLARQYLEVIPMRAITDEHFEVLFELLEAHDFAVRVEALWETHPQAAYHRLVSLLDAGKANQGRAWLTTLPESQLDRLLGHLSTQLDRVGARYPSFESCRNWLHEYCCCRGPGWLRAYGLLADMEARAKRVARVAPPSIRPTDSP